MSGGGIQPVCKDMLLESQELDSFVVNSPGSVFIALHKPLELAILLVWQPAVKCVIPITDSKSLVMNIRNIIQHNGYNIQILIVIQYFIVRILNRPSDFMLWSEVLPNGI